MTCCHGLTPSPAVVVAPSSVPSEYRDHPGEGLVGRNAIECINADVRGQVQRTALDVDSPRAGVVAMSNTGEMLRSCARTGLICNWSGGGSWSAKWVTITRPSRLVRRRSSAWMRNLVSVSCLEFALRLRSSASSKSAGESLTPRLLPRPWRPSQRPLVPSRIRSGITTTVPASKPMRRRPDTLAVPLILLAVVICVFLVYLRWGLEDVSTGE